MFDWDSTRGAIISRVYIADRVASVHYKYCKEKLRRGNKPKPYYNTRIGRIPMDDSMIDSNNYVCCYKNKIEEFTSFIYLKLLKDIKKYIPVTVFGLIAVFLIPRMNLISKTKLYDWILKQPFRLTI